MHLQRLLQKSRIFATILLTSKRMVSALYRVAVCEDEAILCANLCAQCESILDKLKVEHRITSFSSAEKLENALLAGEEFSLLCLDILMDGKTGMKLAQTKPASCLSQALRNFSRTATASALSSTCSSRFRWLSWNRQLQPICGCTTALPQ